MILSVHTDKTVFLEGKREVVEANDRALAPDSVLGCETVSFMYHKDRDPVPKEASLTVTVNPENGFGGLVWYADGVTATRLAETVGHDFADSIWVSINPSPPQFDPEIPSDPWAPTYMDRVSALPLAALRSALEEFCANGTGDRPMCIEWVEGNFDGSLLDDVAGG
ncbi:Imm1 family immunity protein [Streptomyces sp. NPDC015346]|uniref:Imm1 family immunity protein n=1 Tax=Streptomyces sp. NPDC015346 TaxID=3364954 RepID=UPI0036FC2EE2